MTAHIQLISDFTGLNPTLAIATAFIAAGGEAFLIIGSFVPRSVILVGIGGLVGIGKVPFWPIFFQVPVQGSEDMIGVHP